MYSDEFQLRNAQEELERFIYKTKNKQQTNRRNLPERLLNRTMECLCNGKLVLQCPCRGNGKELSYLILNLSGYP